MAKWKKTTFPGVRFREHPTRKNGVKKDQYFTIRYKVQIPDSNNEGQTLSKDREEGLGWASEGWTPSTAYERLKEIKQNIKSAEGPQSLKEKRAIETERRETEKAEVERLERESVTMYDFFNDTYLPRAEANKKERSVTREKGLFDVWIKPALGHFPLKDVAPFHIEQLKKSMKDGNQSPRSIEYGLSLTRQIFNVAKLLGVFEGKNPTAKVEFPKPDNRRMRFLTHNEADALLKALKGKSIDVHDMTLLSLNCGLRFGEIAGLSWQDVNIEEGLLTIRNAKSGSRYAFLTEEAKNMLKTRLTGKPSAYVFQGRTGKMERMSVTFARTVEELKLNEGIDDAKLKVCFHTCRHSYASWLVQSGVPLYTVKELLGHGSISQTERYAKLAPGNLRDAVLTFEKAMIGKPAVAGEVLRLNNGGQK
ncbi:MAG: site-specific integrase [Deltaproteobacteria bacterium]|nr:site-specific integrase [Deltaproteobacteria bacterium]